MRQNKHQSKEYQGAERPLFHICNLRHAVVGVSGFPDLSKATVERENHLAIVAVRRPARRKAKKKARQMSGFEF